MTVHSTCHILFPVLYKSSSWNTVHIIQIINIMSKRHSRKPFIPMPTDEFFSPNHSHASLPNTIFTFIPPISTNLLILVFTSSEGLGPNLLNPAPLLATLYWVALKLNVSRFLRRFRRLEGRRTRSLFIVVNEDDREGGNDSPWDKAWVFVEARLGIVMCEGGKAKLVGEAEVEEKEEPGRADAGSAIRLSKSSSIYIWDLSPTSPWVSWSSNAHRSISGCDWTPSFHHSKSKPPRALNTSNKACGNSSSLRTGGWNRLALNESSSLSAVVSRLVWRATMICPEKVKCTRLGRM